jgi:alpha-tubulin suppressor-like RCC1 family protein
LKRIMQPSLRRRIRRTLGVAALCVPITIAVACQNATEVVLVLRTDLTCADPSPGAYGLKELQVYAGPNRDVVLARVSERDKADLILTQCQGPGELGRTVLFRENSDTAFVQIVAGLSTREPDGSVRFKRAEDCFQAPGAPKPDLRCLNLSRRFTYKRNATGYLVATIQSACTIIDCTKPGDTCIDGICQPEEVALVFEPPPPPPSPRPDDAGADSPVQPRAVAEQLALGEQHSCARLADGTVTCWGTNASGQLGTREPKDRLTRVGLGAFGGARVVELAAAASFNCARTEASKVYCWGKLGAGTMQTTPTLESSLDGATALGGGGSASHMCGLVPGKGLLWWGRGDRGQLGRGDTNDGATPDQTSDTTLGGATLAGPGVVGVGAAHTCFFAGTTRKCWGANRSLGAGDTSSLGILGLGSSNADALEPQIALIPGSATALSLGGHHACALYAAAGAGTLRCWGNNSFGQLGVNEARNKFYGGEPGQTRNSIDFGSLGINLPRVLSAVDWRHVSAGRWHTCGRALDGNVLCWGRGTFGTWGDAKSVMPGAEVRGTDTAPISEPQRIEQRVALPSGATSIASGAEHSCAIVEGGDVYCWGRGADGQVEPRRDEEVNPTPIRVAL